MSAYTTTDTTAATQSGTMQSFMAMLLVLVMSFVISPLSTFAAESNLISNPSFEIADTTDSSLPLNWFKGYFSTTTDDITYTYPVTDAPASEITTGLAARINVNGTISGDAKWYFAPVAIEGGREYAFSDAYISNVPSDLVADFMGTSSEHISYAFSSVPATSASTTWGIASAVFTAPIGATQMTVYHRISSAGTLTVDNYQLHALPLPAPFDYGFVSLSFDDGFMDQYIEAKPKLDAAGLKATFYIVSHITSGFSISNSDLETVDSNNSSEPLNWSHTDTASTTFTYPVTGFNGTGKAAEVNTEVVSSNAGWYFTPITVLPDSIYTFTDNYKSTGTSTIIAQITTTDNTVAVSDEVNDAGISIAPSEIAPSETWNTSRTLFYIPVNAKSVTIIHRLQEAGSLTIDNARLGTADSMTDANILDLQADGQEIGGHSQTHKALTSLSTEDATSEISGGRQEIISGGVSSVLSLAYPYGDFNQSVQSMTNTAGYTSARTVLPGFNGKDTDKFALRTQSINADTTLAQVQAWVTQARANKTWLILVFHNISNNLTNLPYGTTPTTLESILNYLKNEQIPVKTVSEGINFMNGIDGPVVTPTPTPTITPTPAPATGGGGGIYLGNTNTQATTTVATSTAGTIASSTITIAKTYNILDFNLLMINWGRTGNNIPGDFNNDKNVNIMDFNVMLINWSK